MKRIIFATRNAGKMREIRMILAEPDTEVLSMKEAGISADIEENGSTYEENALLKARAVAAAAAMAGAVSSATAVSMSAPAPTSASMPASAQMSAPVSALREGGGAIVLADDSGLEIDALDGEPGVYSARYLGEDTPYSVKNAILIERLRGIPDEKRTARFVCAIAAVLPDGRELTVRACIEGRIGYEERGGGGFGYDPIFFVPELGKTTAELDSDEKNLVSHRGKALRLMKEELKKNESADCQ